MMVNAGVFYHGFYKIDGKGGGLILDSCRFSKISYFGLRFGTVCAVPRARRGVMKPQPEAIEAMHEKRDTQEAVPIPISVR